MSFALDRMNVPEFYTPKDSNNGHKLPSGIILAESDTHHIPGWITVGYVSKQTPFGQGTYLGFKRTQLQKAEPLYVLAAIQLNHPQGSNFRPTLPELMDAGFNQLMSGAIKNWPRRNDYQRQAKKQEELMARWNEITANQIKAIKKHFHMS